MPKTLEERFEQVDEDFLKFKHIQNPLHNRADICAFLLLDKLVPSNSRYIIACAEHDKIWLNIDIEKLNEIATDADILYLVRCGVLYDTDVESLAMFV